MPSFVRSSNDQILSTTFNNSTTYSEAVDISSILGYQVRLAFTGSSIAGSCFIQESVDETNPTNWETVSGSTVTISAAGSQAWNSQKRYAKWFRVGVTSSNANNMTVTARFNAKSL